MKKNLNDLKVGIVGLGYVGLPLAVEFGKVRPVIGFDLNKERVDQINADFDVTSEVPEESLKEAKFLEVTSSIDNLAGCNFFIVAVPTPVDDANIPDLSNLVSATQSVACVLKAGDVVVFESTVFPGVTEEVCAPILEEISGLKFCNNDDDAQANVFYLGYSPERINPGDKLKGLRDIVKITSGSNKRAAELIDNIYASIITAGTYRAETIKVAEAAKVIENIQRDVNIALVNELAIIFERLDIDTKSVLLAAETKWNFAKFSPGLVGGHCIGIDPYYLAYKAQKVGYTPNLILAGRKMNNEMSGFVANQLIKIMLKKSIEVSSSKVLILGLAFKENCSDIRNSKIFDLSKELRDYLCEVDVFDPLVDANVTGSKDFLKIIKKPEAAVYDAIVLAVPHDCFVKLGASGIRQWGKINHVFFDLKSVFNQSESDGRV